MPDQQAVSNCQQGPSSPLAPDDSGPLAPLSIENIGRNAQELPLNLGRDFRISVPDRAMVLIGAILLLSAILAGILHCDKLPFRSAQPIAAHRCESEVSLNIYAPYRDAVMQHIVASYASTAPHIEDLCIRPQLASDFTAAAVLVSSDPIPLVEQQLNHYSRAVASSRWPVAFWESVVLFSPEHLDFSDWGQAAAVAEINREEPLLVQATAATLLAELDQQRAAELLRTPRPEAVVFVGGESVVARDQFRQEFSDVMVPFHAIALQPSRQVPLQATQAAVHFISFLINNVPQHSSETAEQVLEQAGQLASDQVLGLF